MSGSVFYVSATSHVYVIANDPGGDLTASPWNKVFLKGGQLNADGSISFGNLATRQLSGSVGAGTGDCFAGAGVDMALAGDEATGTLAWMCDALRSGSVRTSAIGQSNVNASTTTLSGGTLLTPDSASSISEATTAKQFISLTPVNDAGTYKFLEAQKDRADVPGALRIRRYTQGGTNEALEINIAPGTAGVNDLYSQSMASTGTTSIVHMPYIDSTGALVYNRRTGAGTWNGVITVDNTGSAFATPYGNPSIVFVQDPATIDKVFILYRSTYGSVNYAVGPATAAVTADFVITRDWNAASGGISNPMVPSSVIVPTPIPVQWTQGGAVQFDRLINSNTV